MLCRDHCHYCTFAKPPAKLDAPVPVAGGGRRDRRGGPAARAARRRCSRSATARRSATRWRATWLDERGYGSTLEYVRAVAIRVIEETGLLPHLNPGVMTYEELARLKQVAPSMGMMLETSLGPPVASAAGRTSGRRTRTRPSGCAMIEDAGRLAIPFTTGILVGHRRDRRPSAPSRSSRSAISTGATATSRRSSSRTSGPSPGRRCTTRPSRATRSSWPPSRRRGSCSDRGCTSRRRRTCPTPSSRPASSTPGSTTGAASRRSRPTT